MNKLIWEWNAGAELYTYTVCARNVPNEKIINGAFVTLPLRLGVKCSYCFEIWQTPAVVGTNSAAKKTGKFQNIWKTPKTDHVH